VSRILHFTAGPQDWQALLADPQKHWRTGFSARTLAHCWEAARGLPPEVQAVFASSNEPLLADFTPIIAVPEFRVPLPGGDRHSQNDLFLLGRSRRACLDHGRGQSFRVLRANDRGVAQRCLRRKGRAAFLPSPYRRPRKRARWRKPLSTVPSRSVRSS
jgi:hypothetical protein